VDQLALLQEENLRLRKAVDELSLLNELARVISSTMSLDGVIESVVKRAVRAVKGQQGMITLVDEVAPMEMKTLIRTQNSTSQHEQFHLNQNILGWIMINKKPLLSNDLLNDPRFSGVKVEGDLQSLLCVPLLIRNRMIGILAVFNNNKERTQFTEDDKRLLAIIAAQSAQILENVRLYDEEQKKMVLEKDLIAGREVQMNLLPKHLPRVPHFEFAASTIPAQEIGGDFYDFISMGEKICEVVVADVAGKGLSAALLATLGKGVLYGQAIQLSSPLEQITHSNRVLRSCIPRKSFITMLLALVDAETRTVTLSNAGHCYPLLYRAELKKTELLRVPGMPLNFTDTLICQEQKITFRPHDCLILYSDGVTEAQNGSQEMYGVERLQSLIDSSGEIAPGILMQKILDEIKLFSKGVPQSDDITLLILKATD
jgi:sigma-B regulation protein RsbU (phosphoserine phosphatase)